MLDVCTLIIITLHLGLGDVKLSLAGILVLQPGHDEALRYSAHRSMCMQE